MLNFTFPFCQHVLGAAILLANLLIAGCSHPADAPISNEFSTNSAMTAELESRTVAFCGNCHSMPSPLSFPKDAWYDEAERGFEFYFETGRKDLDPPPLIEVVKYFRDKAPDRLELPRRQAAQSTFGRRFILESIDVADSEQLPAISNVTIRSSDPQRSAEIFTCDARTGELRAFWSTPVESKTQMLAQLKNPSHVEPTDLDGNGVLDLVVADLGSIYPADHHDGRVIWLQSNDGQTSWSPIVLRDGLGRVADVRPGDFDGDGRIDLMVAVFGWHKTGEILWLKNAGVQNHRPEFTSISVDPRHGAIHVPVCDLNRDGRLDFVALISQEYEVVEAFINDGNGAFKRQPIFDAHDPGYGSSGIELVDLDRDGDLDVLYTSGDSFDSKYVKPSHGIHWLENEGQFPFRDHPLAQLPGCYRAIAADFDNDQDLDVVASAFVPRSQISNGSLAELTSLLLLEQIDGEKFREHTLEVGQPRHAALAVVDSDGDGDLDILAGNYFSEATTGSARLTMWRNESLDSGRSRDN